MKKVILAALVIAATLVGCGSTDTVEGGEQKRIRETSVGKLGKYTDFIVMVDVDTGVEYLWVEGTYEGSVTVMMNQDGTPKIAKGY
jgi:uncharacterized protein YcfL